MCRKEGIFLSENFEFEMDGHANIYNKYSPRKLKVYFSTPENINSETGILLLIAGYGGNANSNVYKKMRTQFPDKYNLIVVQCDYFGSKFMQSEPLDETVEHFNDMGIMQAIDNITSVLAVKEIIKDNGYIINEFKTILYGHSHGAYLCYLCNAFAPNLVNLIIDNSAWTFPESFNFDRKLYFPLDHNPNQRKTVTFRYLARKFDFDKELLNLHSLYTKIDTNTNAIIFQGGNDQLVDFEKKRLFSQLLKNKSFNLITKQDLDGDIFKSTTHGLNADFLKLFDLAISNQSFDTKSSIEIESFSITTERFRYNFNYDKKFPMLYID